jgi:hypothetical protein
MSGFSSPQLSTPVSTANGGLGNTAGAWTAYTPTIAAGGGTITTSSAAGAYYVIGKLVHYRFTVTITAAGTGTGVITATVPIGTTTGQAAGSCAETAVTGFAGVCRIAAGSNFFFIAKYDATTLIVNGYTIACAGIYEQT